MSETPEQLRVCASRLELLYSHKEEPLKRAIHAVASAYLAEHPADDAEPVDEAWLRSVGFQNGWHGLFIQTPAGCLEWRNDNDWKVWILCSQASRHDRWPDRGSVRRLLAVMGASPTEPARA